MSLLLFMLLSPLDPSSAFAARAANAWFVEARRLSGESDFVHDAAVSSLKKIANLEVDLKQDLKTNSNHHALALDVITALKMKSLWKDLIDFSAVDESGMAYLAILTMTDESNHMEVKRLFLERIKVQKLSPVSKMVLLDALMRMNQPIPLGDLQSFLKAAGDPEVRSAALYYLRGMTLRNHDLRYLDLLEELKKSKQSIQFRTQLDFFLRELEKEAS